MCENSFVVDLARVINEIVHQTTGIKGSSLGLLLRQRFSPLDIERIGKLSTFIALNCRDVQLQPTAGLDILYVPALGVPQPPTRASTTATKPISWNQMAWKAFISAAPNLHLAVEKLTGTLQVVAALSDLADGWFAVKGLQEQDHIRIANEFIRETAVEDQEVLEQVLQGPDPVRQWYRKMKEFRAGTYNPAWSEFRFKAIGQAFQQRLRDLTVSAEVTETAWHNLLALKASVQKSPVSKRRLGERSEIPTRSELRQLLLKVVGGLSDHELGQIWLPVGAVMDALRR